MFNRREINEPDLLNALIERLIESLANHDPDSTEFTKTTVNLEKLYKMKELFASSEAKATDAHAKQEETLRTCKLREAEAKAKLDEIEARHRVSPETIATIVANVGGILIVLHYERFAVLTSKAIGLVTRLR